MLSRSTTTHKMPYYLNLPIFFTTRTVLYPELSAQVPLDSTANNCYSEKKEHNFYAVLVYTLLEEEKKRYCCGYGTIVWVNTLDYLEKNACADMKGLHRCKILNFDGHRAQVLLIPEEKGTMAQLFPEEYKEITQLITSGSPLVPEEGASALVEKMATTDASEFCYWCFDAFSDDFVIALSYLQIERLADRVTTIIEVLKHGKTGKTQQGADDCCVIKAVANSNVQSKAELEDITCSSDPAMISSNKSNNIPDNAKLLTSLEKSEKNSEEKSKLRTKLENLILPEETREQIMHDLETMERMKENSCSEYYTLRNYLEFVANLPWNVLSVERTDFQNAKKELEKGHEGMVKVKQRIVEYLAVKRLQKANLKGPILCLVGPPGVGKSSIAKAVAKATGRKFAKIALGGVNDNNDIRGHRRTYVGAMPGRIMHGIKVAKSRNPVMLLDEIDKMGSGSKGFGDPAAVLLDVLDAEQNHAFHDNYLNVPFDLSQVMFIATANDIRYIPPALYDRLEIVNMEGYSAEEKVSIAQKHIIPRQLEDHGIRPEQCRLETPVIRKLAAEYTHEAGVRQLERSIAALCRYVAVQLIDHVQDDDKEPQFPIIIDENTLELVLHEQRYNQEILDHRRKNHRIGTAYGVAITPYGGFVQIVEVSTSTGKGRIRMTGSLGNVLKESVEVVITWMKSNSYRLGIPSTIFSERDLHVHLPSGGVNKDGPSGGCSLLLAIFSLLTGRLVRVDTAVTGEMTLTGDILPVGGIKQKVLAAHRASIFRVVLPLANESDLRELQNDVKEAMEIVLVKNADELLKEAMEEKVNLMSKL